MFNFDFMGILYSLPGIFIGFSFHEFAHAIVAYKLGDNTAKYQGRLTLDPTSHIDPMGFIMLILFRFGWAKPVPVNPLNFKDRKTGMILVSLAGPMMNFTIAFISLLFYGLLFYKFKYTNPIVENILYITYIINLNLGVFNLIPFPPLDGSKILAGLLPVKYEYSFYKYEHYSQILLLILIFTNTIHIVLDPLFSVVNISLQNIVNLII